MRILLIVEMTKRQFTSCGSSELEKKKSVNYRLKFAVNNWNNSCWVLINHQASVAKIGRKFKTPQSYSSSEQANMLLD